MGERIRLGIIGYGNVGKGVELALEQNPDMALGGIFTRRASTRLATQLPTSRVFHISRIADHVNDLDVAILCGGSATDLPEQGPKFASMFNTVDSFDTHAKISEYFRSVDKAARGAGKTSVISVGWDPGLFSLLRLIGEVSLPNGKDYTFWGPGVSQGHSNAIRGIEGVRDAVQYTIPIEAAVKRVRAGENPDLTPRERHRRECYVVAETGADLDRIRHEIQTMPNYFADYDTSVTFITQEELKAKHSGMPHGGFVLRTGTTGANHRHVMEFALKLDSNPEFTGNVLVAYARAAYRLNREGQIGARTVFDIPAAYLSPRPPEELRTKLL